MIVRPENCSVRLTPPCTTGERTNRTNELALNWIILRKVTRLKNLRTNPCVDFTSFNYEVQCKCRSPMRGTRKKKKKKITNRNCQIALLNLADVLIAYFKFCPISSVSVSTLTFTSLVASFRPVACYNNVYDCQIS